MSSNQPDAPIPVTEELEHEVDNFITLLQQLLKSNILNIHQLSHSISTSESSTDYPTKHKKDPTESLNANISTHNPNSLLATPTSPTIFFRPQHTKTKEFLTYNLPFVPQYTYYQTTNDHQLIIVDEHSLFPTIPWTSYYHLTNPSALPSNNNPADNKLCQSRLHKLTIALHEKQITTIGLNQALNRYIAPRANEFLIKPYDHTITHYLEDTAIEDDLNNNSQLTEKILSSQNMYSMKIVLMKILKTSSSLH